MNQTQNVQLTVDAVVFGYSKEEGVSLLLIKRKYDPYKGSWAIPGGFVLDDESLEEAVERELMEETGVKINYLEQLYTFGEAKSRSKIQNRVRCLFRLSQIEPVSKAKSDN